MSENKIITVDGEQINLSELEDEFGSYTFEGKTYYARNNMSRTDRDFPQSWNHVGEDSKYIDEFCAEGYAEDGTKVLITMQFEADRDNEVEDYNYNWDQDAEKVDVVEW